MTDNNKISRRKALKTIGSASAIGIGTGLSSGIASAVEGVQVTELTGVDKYRAYASTVRSKDFRQLRQSLRQDGHALRGREVRAYRVEAEGGASFEAITVSYDTDSDDKTVEIGFRVRGRTPVPNKGVVLYRHEDGRPYKSEEYILSEDIDGSAIATASTDGLRSSTEELTVGQGTVIKRTTNIDVTPGTQPSPDGAEVGTMAPEPCQISSISCVDCKNLVSAVNIVGCGTASWLISAIAGVASGGLAGLGCALVVGIICWIIIDIGTNNPQAVCSADYSCEMPCA